MRALDSYRRNPQDPRRQQPQQRRSAPGSGQRSRNSNPGRSPQGRRQNPDSLRIREPFGYENEYYQQESYGSYNDRRRSAPSGYDRYDHDYRQDSYRVQRDPHDRQDGSRTRRDPAPRQDDYYEPRRSQRPRQKRKPPLKKPFRVLKKLYILLVVLAVFIIVGYGIFKVAFRAPDVTDDPPTASDPYDQGVAPTIGTSSYNRKPSTYTFLLTCPDQVSGNADSIMVVTYDVGNQKIGMLSIPRDTLVNRKNPKINAAFHGGVENLQEVVSDMLGIPLDFYIVLNLEAFVEIVDAVGGIDFDVPVEMYYNDPTQDLNIFYQPGYQHLSGQQAMEVCRFRKNGDGTGYPMGDVQRSETCRNVILTVVRKLMSFENITRINDFVDIINKNVETNLERRNFVYFGVQAMGLDMSTAVNGGTLPGDGNASYNGTNYCYELYPDESLELVNNLVNPYTEPLTLADTNFFTP